MREHPSGGRLSQLLHELRDNPEVACGLAMNGAEIIIRPTLIEPAVMNGMWELQNRAHAVFNQVFKLFAIARRCGQSTSWKRSISVWSDGAANAP